MNIYLYDRRCCARDFEAVTGQSLAAISDGGVAA